MFMKFSSVNKNMTFPNVYDSKREYCDNLIMKFE